MKLVKVLIITLVLTLSAILPVQADEIFIPVVLLDANYPEPSGPINVKPPDMSPDVVFVEPSQACNPACASIYVNVTCWDHGGPPWNRLPTDIEPNNAWYYEGDLLPGAAIDYSGYATYIGVWGNYRQYKAAMFTWSAGNYRAHVTRIGQPPAGWWSAWLYQTIPQNGIGIWQFSHIYASDHPVCN